MKNTLKPGITYTHQFQLTEKKMVPALYPEADEFLAMPEVFATGFMVGFIEWACLKAVISHIDWPRQQTVGTHVNMSHTAATPSGFTVIAEVELVAVEGRRLTFKVKAHDGVDTISAGTHERFVIDRQRFDDAVREKVGRIIT